jgi:hypothetical protein
MFTCNHYYNAQTSTGKLATTVLESYEVKPKRAGEICTATHLFQYTLR